MQRNYCAHTYYIENLFALDFACVAGINALLIFGG